MGQSPRRVVSLIASATEIVSALGARCRLVGRSHECDYPADVSALPALTSPKFELSGTSGEIDAKVRAIVADGLAVYKVDAAALKELAPDLIVTQDQCDVCAVSLADVEAAVCEWSGPDVRVLSLKPDSLDDIYRDIRNVAAALGEERAGESLVGSMQGRLRQIAERAKPLARPRVGFIEWGEPLMSGGNWMPTLFEIAGGISLFGVAGRRSEVMTWDGFAAGDPDVIIIAPCGYDLPATFKEHYALSRRPEWMSLKAVRDGRVYCADGNAYFNRPGPRVVETAEIVAEILHPQSFAFGHDGTGWVKA